MTRNIEWNWLIESLLSNALENFHATKQYEYHRTRRVHIDEMLTNNLMKNEKALVDEVLLELSKAAEYETKMLYSQGLQDCIWALKNLGVLA